MLNKTQSGLLKAQAVPNQAIKYNQCVSPSGSANEIAVFTSN
jgi:hypothetical protein